MVEDIDDSMEDEDTTSDGDEDKSPASGSPSNSSLCKWGNYMAQV